LEKSQCVDTPLSRKTGISIVFGTGSSVSVHGDNGWEFALIAKAGMLLTKTIQTALLNAVTLHGQRNNLGQDKLVNILILLLFITTF